MFCVLFGQSRLLVALLELLPLGVFNLFDRRPTLFLNFVFVFVYDFRDLAFEGVDRGRRMISHL